MHFFHSDPAANRLLNLIAQLQLRAADVMRADALMMAWDRYGQATQEFSTALQRLLDDQLLRSSPSGFQLRPACYALLTDELALPMKGELAPYDDALRPPDPVIRERLLTLLITAHEGRCSDQELASAWRATGERDALLRRAVSLCQASGHVSRARWGRREFFATLAGQRWIAGRPCPQPLLTLARQLQRDALPPKVHDEELTVLALGAFNRPAVGAKLSTAHMTNFLRRCGVPESLWFHAIELLHRAGLIDATDKTTVLRLTEDGFEACKRRRSIRARLRLTRAVQDFRSAASESGG